MSSSDPKYLVVKEPEFGNEVAIIFPPTVTHKVMGMNRRCGEVLSAGFFHITDTGCQAYGESESLKMRSSPERDSRLLDQALRLGNFKTPW